MRRLTRLASAALLPLLTLTACTPARTPGSGAASTPPSAAPSSTSQTSQPSSTGNVEGAVLRFRSEDTTVDVTIGEDNPTVRDLISKLPLQLTAEEFAGREKTADIPGGLTTDGSPGSDPEDGDLIYYTPWGNLGFYYDTTGVDYSDQTIHLGTYDASRQQLNQLEGPITVDLVD